MPCGGKRGGLRIGEATRQVRCLLPANTVSWTDMEWLKNVSVVVCEPCVSQKSLGMEVEGVLEVLFHVIYSPMVDAHNGLRSG